MITLTIEQAQQIEEALDKADSVYKANEIHKIAVQQVQKALAAIRAARAQEDTVCGFSLWLNRESWGHVVDGLMLERERSEQRKTANPESNSNIISARCAELITQINDAGGVIRAARAQEQAEQEPVACGCGTTAYCLIRQTNLPEHNFTPICLSCLQEQLRIEQNVQEVNEHEMNNFGGAYGLVTWETKPLYAAPVRTKDLTDEEIWEAYRTVTIPVSTPKIARAVIAADREKNK